eukprot:6413188-Pyramimonas_sp.AAC.1
MKPSSDLSIRQADASNVCRSIHVITSSAAPHTAWVSCRKPRIPLRMTRIIEQFRGSRSSSRPSSELSVRQTDATDVSESIPVARSTVALPQHDFSTENREHFSR